MKVLVYNILNGGGKRLDGIAKIIRCEQPDAVALLEATSRWKAIKLARKVNMKLVFAKANSSFHVAWLSRLPVERSENYRIPELAKTMLEIEVIWNNAPLRLFATHLAGGADVVHPSEEAQAILRLLGPMAKLPHLLVGDFNALHPDDSIGQPPPGAERMRTSIDSDPRRAIESILEAGYTDCFRTFNPRLPGFTYPTTSPWLRLDYIFASSDIAANLNGSEVVAQPATRDASDHLPVWATFK